MSAMPPSRWRESRYARKIAYCSEVGIASRISLTTSALRRMMRRMLRVGRNSLASTRTETQERQPSQAGR